MSDSFILYTDVYDSIKDLPLEDKGQLLDAIFIYVINEEEIALSPTTKIAFSFIKRSLARNLTRWKKVKNARKLAGQKGGLKRAENERLLRTKASKSKQSLANQAVPVPVPVPVPVINIKDINSPFVNNSGPKTPKVQTSTISAENKPIWDFLTAASNADRARRGE